MRGGVLNILAVTFGVVLIGRVAMLSIENADAKEEIAAPAEVVETKSSDQSEGEAEKSEPAQVSQKPKDMSSNTDESCLSVELAEVVSARALQLDEREALIVERETALAALEDKLNEKIKVAEEANTRLKNNVDFLKNTANEDVSHLVNMYQAMKPKQAAEIFNNMDPKFAAGFLRQIESQQAGLIMSYMDSKKSYAVSVVMASRNARYRDSGKG